MSRLSEAIRAEIIQQFWFFFGEMGTKRSRRKAALKVREYLLERYGGKSKLDEKTIMRTVERFQEHHTLSDRPRRHRSVPEEKSKRVMDVIRENPNISVRQLSKATEASKTFCHTKLQEYHRLQRKKTPNKAKLAAKAEEAASVCENGSLLFESTMEISAVADTTGVDETGIEDTTGAELTGAEVITYGKIEPTDDVVDETGVHVGEGGDTEMTANDGVDIGANETPAAVAAE